MTNMQFELCELKKAYMLCLEFKLQDGAELWRQPNCGQSYKPKPSTFANYDFSYSHTD